MSGVDDEVWVEDAWFAALEAVPVPNGDEIMISEPVGVSGDESMISEHVGVSGDVVFEKEVAPLTSRVKRVKYVDVTGEDVVIVYK